LNLQCIDPQIIPNFIPNENHAAFSCCSPKLLSTQSRCINERRTGKIRRKDDMYVLMVYIGLPVSSAVPIIIRTARSLALFSGIFIRIAELGSYTSLIL
jgi:hypothetical protein